VTIDIAHGNIGPQGNTQVLGLPIAEKELKGKISKKENIKILTWILNMMDNHLLNLDA
jgi:hypothetical protein